MNEAVVVYDFLPQDFSPHVEVSSCYLEIDGSILLLECGNQKEEKGAWGVPAGKIEKGETPQEAARRELWEETGILIQETEKISCLGTLYIQKPHVRYVYHMFKVSLDEKPQIVISQEHSGYKWVKRDDLTSVPLMLGAVDCLNKYFSYKG